MWLRDSANQVQSYLPLLQASSSQDSLASLYRGVINLQARYILTDPYCNSFQAPAESGLPPSQNDAASDDTVKPTYNNASIFECKYELDSLAAFLEVSSDYYNATQDIDFFGKYSWVSAVESILKVAEDMMVPTYSDDGAVTNISYTFTRETTRATETQSNGKQETFVIFIMRTKLCFSDGLGNPFNRTGLVRSFFRPSDDATIYQGLIPSNMMFSHFLSLTAPIMTRLGNQDALADRMSSMASSVRAAITKNGIVNTAEYGRVYAYEVDGYMGQNMSE